MPACSSDVGQPDRWHRSLERSLARRTAALRRRRRRRSWRALATIALAMLTIGAAGALATPAGAGGTLVLKGSSGAVVTQIQSRLQIAADGRFGVATDHAVRAFQRANGLLVDGIVGPQTSRALGITLFGWVVMVVLAWLASGPALFWVAAVIAGLCMGSSQSAGRAIVGSLGPSLGFRPASVTERDGQRDAGRALAFVVHVGAGHGGVVGPPVDAERGLGLAALPAPARAVLVLDEVRPAGSVAGVRGIGRPQGPVARPRRIDDVGAPAARPPPVRDPDGRPLGVGCGGVVFARGRRAA